MLGFHNVIDFCCLNCITSMIDDLSNMTKSGLFKLSQINVLKRFLLDRLWWHIFKHITTQKKAKFMTTESVNVPTLDYVCFCCAFFHFVGYPLSIPSLGWIWLQNGNRIERRNTYNISDIITEQFNKNSFYISLETNDKYISQRRESSVIDCGTNHKMD